jgi:hypothetical protein
MTAWTSLWIGCGKLVDEPMENRRRKLWAAGRVSV